MPNRLATARSTYLRQHAENPVDWYPWGEDAFARARDLDRPLLLSVGYAACHWCHVMAHETFEDAALARAVNEAFVPVKVDRQEHPAVDAIYQTICHAVTGQGGWPLTVFLTPDRRPFYVGTYFPPRSRYGQPGFADIVGGLAEAWRRDRAQVLAVAEEWAGLLRRLEEGRPPTAGPSEAPGRDVVAGAVDRLSADLDPVHGGFAGAPKFPQTEALELLLRAGGRAAARAHFALRCMIGGGIHDQVGGGFHRYSVDAAWQIPHFEKMLYDNALIPVALLSAFQQTADPEFARVARRALDYLLRDMRAPLGGFYSAEDADSLAADGHAEEGAFYTWTPAEIYAVLGDPDLAALNCMHFGVTAQGNFAGGRTVLHLHALSRETPPAAGEPGGAGERAATVLAAEEDPGVARARDALLRARSLRHRPTRDEQVLAGWNGLALSAYARAGRILAEPRYVQAARAAAAFLLAEMRAPDGGLFRRWFQGEAGLPGALEDYAYVAGGLIDLYEASLEPRWLVEALGLARQAMRRFWDPARAAFFLVEAGRTDLLYRPQDPGDSGTPSAESAAVAVLLRLAPYVEEPAFREVPAAACERQAEAMRRHPRGMASWLCALDLAVGGAREVVLAAPVGEPAAERQVGEWRARLAARYLPDLVLSRWAEGLPGEPTVPPVWAGRGPVGGRATLWVCRGGACLPPVHAWEEVDGVLGGGAASIPRGV